MKISKVKLIEQGMKGITVTYSEVQPKDGMHYNNDYTVTFRQPVQGKVMNLFQDLQEHFIGITGMEEESETLVTGFSFDGDNIQLGGKVYVLARPLTFGLSAPMVGDDDGYSKFEKLRDICKEIYTLVAEYTKGNNDVDVAQFIRDYTTKNPAKAAELPVDEMTKEEQIDYYRSVLEKNGGIVIMQEDRDDEVGNFDEAPIAKAEKGQATLKMA